MRKHTIWWENQARTVVTAYEEGVSRGTGSGSNELGALWDLWNKLADSDASTPLRDRVAAEYRSLSGGRDISTFVLDSSRVRSAKAEPGGPRRASNRGS